MGIRRKTHKRNVFCTSAKCQALLPLPFCFAVLRNHWKVMKTGGKSFAAVAALPFPMWNLEPALPSAAALTAGLDGNIDFPGMSLERRNDCDSAQRGGTGWEGDVSWFFHPFPMNPFWNLPRFLISPARTRPCRALLQGSCLCFPGCAHTSVQLLHLQPGKVGIFSRFWEGRGPELVQGWEGQPG